MNKRIAPRARIREKVEVGSSVVVHKSGARSIELGKLVQSPQFKRDLNIVRKKTKSDRKIVDVG